ncbi:MAG: FG-GAP-like repeat-containing protein [Candidatus Hodarchaeota archaeon]
MKIKNNRKNIIGLICFFTILILFSQSSTRNSAGFEGDTSDVAWVFNTGGVVGPSPAAADIDGDGHVEVVIGCWDENVYCIWGENGSLKWNRTVGAVSDSAPVLKDVDGDGIMEVFIGTLDQNFYCLNGDDGSIKWNHSVLMWILTNPAVGDVDDDGEYEVVFACFDGVVYCLNASNGYFEWDFTSADYIDSSPAIADIDNDGTLEVLFGGCSLDTHFYCLSGNNGSLEWDYDVGDEITSNPAIGDVDHDGYLEVIFGSNDYSVYCLNATESTNATLEWSFPTSNVVDTGPVIGDVNDDGQMDVVVGSDDGKIYCLNGSSGSETWSFNTTGNVLATPALYDIDNDGILEVICPSFDDYLYCLSGIDGKTEWRKFIDISYSSPTIYDVDGDNKDEILVGSTDDKLYCLIGKGAPGAKNGPWPCAGASPQHGSFFIDDAYAPELTNPNVNVTSGNQSTPIKFNVTYTDQDNSAPVYVRLNVNDTYYVMKKQTPSDTNYTDGCVFELVIYLQPGDYNYSFSCRDWNHFNSTQVFSWINISGFNSQAPLLTSGTVDPKIGYLVYDTFRFSVNYSDPDNNAPAYVNVTVGPTSYEMELVDRFDTNFMDGKEYECFITFNFSQDFNYSFNCSDGTNTFDLGPFGDLVVKEFVMDNYTMYVDYDYAWVDASDGVPAGLTGSHYIDTFHLPFNFSFYNQKFDTISISQWGYATFSDYMMNVNEPFPYAPAMYMIAPFWDDLDGGGSDKIFIKNLTSPNRYVIEWKDIRMWDIFPPGPLVGTFEIILYENGDIILNYDYLDRGTGYTCGLNYGVNTSYYTSFTALNTSIDDFCLYFTNKSNYFNPELSSPQVTPPTGNQSILYNFSVVYTDIDDNMPRYVNVEINGTSYPMEMVVGSDSNYTDGCVFHYLTYLDPGDYNYSFQCADRDFTNATATFTNLTITRSNLNGPVLTNPSMTPGAGVVNVTLFNFTVEYFDADNNIPDSVNVSINSTNYTMVKVDPTDINYMDGCWYTVALMLEDIGNYTHSFYCSDGDYMGSIGPYGGPLVTSLKNYEMVADVPYEWINATDGVQCTMADRDDGSQLFYLPFNFTYYSETFDYMYVCTNGFVSFVDYTAASNPAFPTAAYDFVISPFWDDLEADNPRNIYVKNLTYPNRVVVEWENIWTWGRSFGIGNLVGSFEIVLYETGDILFNYDYVQYTGTGYTCGLNYGLNTSYYNTYTGITASTDDFSILFAQPQNYFSPSLTSGMVQPLTGNSTLLYNFSVQYSDPDNNRPISINVSINGTDYPMEKFYPTDFYYLDGSLYYYTTYLQPGDYEYAFSCFDGAFTETTSIYSNLTVLDENAYAPVLSNYTISPDHGYNGTTWFDFTANYTDNDNDAPEYVNLTIINNTYTMVKVNASDVNYMDGCIFSYTMMLPEGTHDYAFNSSDGINLVGLESITPIVVTGLLIDEDFESYTVNSYIRNYPGWDATADSYTPRVRYVDGSNWLEIRDPYTVTVTDAWWDLPGSVPYRGSISFIVQGNLGYTMSFYLSDHYNDWFNGITNNGSAGIRFYAGQIQARNGSSYINLCPVNTSSRYHIVIFYDLDIGWHVDINSTKYTLNGSDYSFNFTGSPKRFDHFEATSRLDQSGYQFYLDNISISWTPNTPADLVGNPVTPPGANQSDLLNFSVVYSDIDDNPAISVTLTVDGINFPMISTNPNTTNYATGCTYFTQIYLQPGSHDYFFTTFDGFDNSSTSNASVVISETNSAGPLLSDGQVDLMEGWNQTSIFTFTINYSDPDNNKPSFINVTVGNSSFIMTQIDPTDTNLIDGAFFSGGGRLDTGVYEYYFNTSDGTYNASLGPFPGLNVKEYFIEVDFEKYADNEGINNKDGWHSQIQSGDSSHVYVELMSGNKWLELYDYRFGNTECIAWWDLPRTTPSRGHVAFKFMIDDANKDARIYLSEGFQSDYLGETYDGAMILRIYQYKFWVRDNTTWTQIADAANMTVYFIVMHFDLDLGWYLEINDTVYTKNGTAYDYMFDGSINSLEFLEFSTETGMANTYYNIYADDIAVSWTPNVPPTLSSSSVLPSSGNQSTLYNFSIQYTDQNSNPPDWINLILDGMVIPLSPVNASDRDYTDGATFTFQLYVQPGTRSYYFEANDGTVTVNTSTYNMTVTPTNDYAPILSNESLSPKTGRNGTTIFSFVVNYTDGDNNAPSIIVLQLNSTNITLEKIDPYDTNFMDGCLYYHNTTLEFGRYVYAFICNDSTYTTMLGPYSDLFVEQWLIDETFNDYAVGFVLDINPLWFDLTAGSAAVTTYQGDIQADWYDYSDSFYIDAYRVVIPYSGVVDWFVEYELTWIQGEQIMYLTDGPDPTDEIFYLSVNRTTGELLYYNGTDYFTCDTPTFLVSGQQCRIKVGKNSSTPGLFEIYVNDILIESNATGPYDQDVDIARIGYRTPLLGPVDRFYIDNINFMWNEFVPFFANPAVSPSIGDPRDEYNFTVDVFDYDNREPVNVSVVINGTLYTMTKVNAADTNYIDGCTYQYLRNFTVGTYEYYFTCFDGLFTNQTNLLPNLLVHSINDYDPILSGENVDPTDGFQGETLFRFSVNYTDWDNDAPSYINITINGSTFSMSKMNSGDTNYTDGCIYEFYTTLLEGNYMFHFNCSDGIRNASSGPFFGPTVEMSYLFTLMEIEHNHYSSEVGWWQPSSFLYFQVNDSVYTVFYNAYGVMENCLIDQKTRLISNSDSAYFTNDTHTPAWIFTDVNIGDFVPICVYPDGDHVFNVTGETFFFSPAIGMVKAWILEDLNVSGGIAFYEQESGVLLNGTFVYYNPGFNFYTYDFISTNAMVYDYAYSNQPSDVFMLKNTTLNQIAWKLIDSQGAGDYRVLLNGSTLQDWITWTNDTFINITINGNQGLGWWEYTIEFNNSRGDFGLPDTVQVFIDEIPLVLSSSADLMVQQNSTAPELNWTLIDAVGPGVYSIYLDGALIQGNFSWSNNSEINTTADTNIGIGIFNYTIRYWDSNGFEGIQDTILITIDDTPTITQFPSPLSFLENSTNVYLNWTIVDSSGGGNYSVIRNGTFIVLNQNWTSGVNVSVSVDTNIGLGIFNYTIFIQDYNGFLGSRTEIVKVDDIPTIIGPIPANELYMEGSIGVQINWTLEDGFLPGNYTVYRNGVPVPLHDSQPWLNNTPIFIEINTSMVGFFNYTIIYCDSNGYYGSPGQVNITIDDIPVVTGTIPGNQLIMNGSAGNQIIWTLIDGLGAGNYTVYRDGVPLSLHDNQPWVNNTSIIVDVNSSTLGVFNYTLVFNDSNGHWGTPQQVNVTVGDVPVVISAPVPEMFVQNATMAAITWWLSDNSGGGLYTVYVDSVPLIVDQPWNNATPIVVDVDTNLGLGFINYTISFQDNHGFLGLNSSVIIIIDDRPIVTLKSSDQEFAQNAEGAFVFWIISDSSGSVNYTVLVDGSPLPGYINVTCYSSVTIVVNVDTSVDIGEYNYTIVYIDANGNPGNNSSVIVTITASSPSNFFLDIERSWWLYAMFVVGFIAIVSGSVHRSKKMKLKTAASKLPPTSFTEKEIPQQGKSMPDLEGVMLDFDEAPPEEKETVLEEPKEQEYPAGISDIPDGNPETVQSPGEKLFCLECKETYTIEHVPDGEWYSCSKCNVTLVIVRNCIHCGNEIALSREDYVRFKNSRVKCPICKNETII